MKKRLRLLLDEETGKRQLHYYLEKNQKARARLMAALLDDHLLEYELVTKKLNITPAGHPGAGGAGRSGHRE